MPRKLKRKAKKLQGKDILGASGMEALSDMVTDVLKLSKEEIERRELESRTSNRLSN